MKKHIPLLTAMAALAALITATYSGCSNTQVESTWTAPGTTKFNFQKVLVVMLNPDGSTRRLAEDTIRAQIPNINTISSYTLFPDNESLKSGTRVQQVLKQLNIDGAIVVRLVSKDTEITSTGGPGPIGPYGSFWGAYGAWGWGGAWAGDIQTDTVIGLETNVYEMSGDKLVYSAVTKTTDPTNIKDLISSASQALRGELEKQGLIPKSK